MRRSLALVAIFVTTAVAARLQAAEPPAEDLVARGLELRRQAKPQQALEMFQRAYALAPSARTLGQMGLVEASLERWLDAEAHLKASLAVPDDGWVKKNRGFLDEALAVSRAHVGELVITGPATTAVAIDGKAVGTLPTIAPIRLVEGDVAVTASGDGFKDFSKTVKIVGGAKVSLAIVLDPIGKRPAVALAAPTPLPASSATSPLPPPLVVADHGGGPAWRTWTGAGLVAAGVGLAAWGAVWIAIDGKDGCAAAGPACATVYDTRSTGWILAAGGAAAAAGGTIILFTGRRDERAPGANVALAASPNALLLRGQF
ncbi:MAG TPA: hypothetical protein VKQ32_21960 [Polyangia bacterium]|nr:hypothetical protein [Polyangia bacterium]